MKNLWWAVSLLLLSMACEEKDDYTFTVFELNETTVTPAWEAFGVFTTDRDTILVNTLSLVDSRCPIDVTCVRAGDYTVELELTQVPDNAHVTLCNGDCNPNVSIMDSVEFTLRGQDYWIRMENLLPYPNTGRPPDQEQTIYFNIFEAD